LITIQKLLDIVRIEPTWGSSEGMSMSRIEEARTTTSSLTEFAVKHKVFKIVTDAIEFLAQELKEQLRAISHIDSAISEMQKTMIHSL
jgi:hypothetical protein